MASLEELRQRTVDTVFAATETVDRVAEVKATVAITAANALASTEAARASLASIDAKTPPLALSAIRIRANGTTLCKSGAGHLHRVVIETAGRGRTL